VNGKVFELVATITAAVCTSSHTMIAIMCFHARIDCRLGHASTATPRMTASVDGGGTVEIAAIVMGGLNELVIAGAIERATSPFLPSELVIAGAIRRATSPFIGWPSQNPLDGDISRVLSFR